MSDAEVAKVTQQALAWLIPVDRFSLVDAHIKKLAIEFGRDHGWGHDRPSRLEELVELRQLLRAYIPAAFRTSRHSY